ncbi:MAG: metallophosphoesterase family protein [Desulfobulbales bacterium]|nr:metallophosphoesterase family protein [Desulfobulbales bacterium]
MKIIVFGDIHMDTGAVDKIPGIESAGHIIITGDITNYGSSSDAEAVLNRLLPLNPSILAVAGNLDQPDVTRYLENLGISLHGNGRMLNGLGILGLGGSNFTPFNTPNEFSEQEINSILASGYERIKGAKDFILVSHPPPLQTKTDRLLNGNHVGSSAVRAFIEKQQPLLCLSGHIHESRGQDHIGKTLVLNPGMLKDGGYIEVCYEKGEISAELHP